MVPKAIFIYILGAAFALLAIAQPRLQKTRNVVVFIYCTNILVCLSVYLFSIRQFCAQTK